MSKTNFNEFRFSGLNMKDMSNKYFTMERVSDDETKIVVKVSDSHLVKTKYGYALILNCNHVVFLKEWQVSSNYFGNEVLMTKEYFNVKEWGSFDDFDNDDANLSWDSWLSTAKEQNASAEEDEIMVRVNPVRWEK